MLRGTTPIGCLRIEMGALGFAGGDLVQGTL